MTASQTQTADETAVLDVLKGVYEAWDAYDADAFTAKYTEDASAILAGSYLNSREAIREDMRIGFSTYLKGSTTADKVLDVRFLNADTAIVVTETGVLFPGESAVPDDRLVTASWVLARSEGEWLIAAYQNSPTVKTD